MWWWPLCACTPDETDKAPAGGDDGPRDSAAEPPTETDLPPGPTGSTGDTGEPPYTGPMPWERSTFDCAAVSHDVVTGTRLGWVPSSEDYTFSDDGFVWGVVGGNLKKTPYGGGGAVVVPGMGDVRGTRFLPDGRLAMSHPEDASVWVVDVTTGSGVPVASGLDTPNGLAVDFEGRIAVATQQRIVRIDPDTGDTEVLVEMAGRSFDGIVYAPDFQRLYFNEELGRVHWIDFHPDGTWSAPQGPIQVVTGPLIGFGILDGMAVDVCGNLYANEMDGHVWRVRVDDGAVELVANIGGASIIPALNFGYPSQGGWTADHLYVMDFLGSLIELPVGVPGKWEPHLPWPPLPE